jgi:hypothetical protein
VYEDNKSQNIVRVVEPTFGKALMKRADRVYHSGKYVNTEKRAITLFINIDD